MSNFEGRFLKKWSKLKKIHVFLINFFANIFKSVSLTVFFMVLGAQSMAVVVSYGEGMVLSFKMSHGEAL